MIKIAPLAAFLVGAILLAPVAPAFAVSTEDAPTNPDGTAVADPDESPDDTVNPDYDTGGSATIEVPPIDAPGEDSGDYSPPDSEDDPADDPAGDAPPAQDDSGD